VAAANSKAYGGGMFVAPEAEPDDGLLDVVTTADVPKLRFLRGLPKVFKGTHLAEEEVGCFRAPEVRIDADRRFAVFADGEHITDLPVTIRLLPRSLSVIAPTTPP
jgi:diacylglycerol kinase family enzyme